MSEIKKTGRPRTGQLIWRKSGWHARYIKTVDGERIRVCEPLHTENKVAARAKLKRMLAAPPGETVEVHPETVAEACERVHEARKADGSKDAKNEIARLRQYAVPAIGHLEAARVKPTDINAALDLCKSNGKARQTVQHLRQDLRNVFGVLRREGVIAQNPVDDSEMPKFSAELRKERAVLTDDELARYLAWEHPDKAQRGAVLERQTMACVSRMFGGLRTGDLHALRWEAFDSAEGKFTWGWAPRQKTKRPQLLEVPEMLRPILRDWWERAGRPTAGLLFPSRRGKRAGEGKSKVSHAKAFRRDLVRAFGIELPETSTVMRSNGRRLTKIIWKPERAFTARERELFLETEYTLPVDFHSWRRAYSQALADADVNAQKAMALAGHASPAAHARYLANAGKLRRLPEAALPNFKVWAATVPKVPEAENESSMIPGGRDVDRTRDIRLVRPALYR